MLPGRADEVARIDRLLDGARGGMSAALIVHGDPGIGKTALLDEGAARAAGFTVLRARPLQTESELPFAGLSDLLRPLLHLLDRIPEPQAAVLSGALALGPPTPGDRFAAAAATISLLAAGAEAAPVLAVVDDAQWLDTPSRESLLFAGRRLRSTRGRNGANAVDDAEGSDQGPACLCACRSRGRGPIKSAVGPGPTMAQQPGPAARRGHGAPVRLMGERALTTKLTELVMTGEAARFAISAVAPERTRVAADRSHRWSEVLASLVA